MLIAVRNKKNKVVIIFDDHREWLKTNIRSLCIQYYNLLNNYDLRVVVKGAGKGINDIATAFMVAQMRMERANRLGIE